MIVFKYNVFYILDLNLPKEGIISHKISLKKNPIRR